MLETLARVAHAQQARLAACFCAQAAAAAGAVGPAPPVPQPSLDGMDTVSAMAPAVARWLVFMADPANRADPEAAQALQAPLAQLLAEAGVGLADVARAFHALKAEWRRLLLETEGEADNRQAALGTLHRLLDLALVAVIDATVPPPLASAGGGDPGSSAAAPAQPPWAAPRLEDERSTQIHVLTEEENRYLRAVLDFGHGPDLRLLGASRFGDWFHQRAPLLVEGRPDADDAGAPTGLRPALPGPFAQGELLRIAQTLDHLDGTVLPRLSEVLARGDSSASQARVIREVVADIAAIRTQVHALFDRLAQTEGFRDPVTGLFSRAVLPSVLKREIELARRRQSTFSVLVLQVDALEGLVQHHGSALAEQVLQHLAGVLGGQVRSTDFVFRYRPDAFLVLLAELNADDAGQVAQKILNKLAEAPRPPGMGDDWAVGLSMGVAPFDGHPDPLHLMQRADDALHHARTHGPGRLHVAG